MDSSALEDAKNGLIGFFESMKVWEEKYHKLIVSAFSGVGNVDSIRSDAKSDLEGIFNEHCVKGKTDWGRLDLVNAGWPTTYDKDRDGISLISDDGKSLVFEYKQNIVGGWLIRFHLKNLGGKWLIGKAEHFDDMKNSWRRHVL